MIESLQIGPSEMRRDGLEYPMFWDCYPFESRQRGFRPKKSENPFFLGLVAVCSLLGWMDLRKVRLLRRGVMVGRSFQVQIGGELVTGFESFNHVDSQ